MTKLLLSLLSSLFILQTSGQYTLNFSEVSHDTTQQKKEIVDAIQTFNFSDVAMTLNLKQLKDTNNKTVSVYWKKNNLWKVSWSIDWAANGVRNVLFDENQNIKLVIDEAHGSKWARENFAYVNDDHFYIYGVDGTIQYNNEGTGKVSYKNQLQTKMKLIEKSVPESKTMEALNIKDIKNRALNYFNEAQAISNQLHKGKYLFEGKIGWKVAFQMKWKVKRNGKIKGEIIYLSDQERNNLSGRISEERFSLKVTNDSHAAEGRVIGRIINQETYRGQLFLDGAEEGEFFEMTILPDQKK